MKSLNKNAVARLAFLAFAIALAIFAYVNTLNLPRAGYELPRLLVYLIIFLSAISLIETATVAFKWRKEIEEAESSGRKKSEKLLIKEKTVKDLLDDSKFNDIMVKRVIGALLLIAAYVFSINPVGYFITTPVFIIAAYYLLKATRPLYMVFISLGFTCFVYFLFVVFLNLPVPAGILG